jgi:hypothetical protein
VNQQSIGRKWNLTGSNARSRIFLIDRTSRSPCELHDDWDKLKHLAVELLVEQVS